MNFDGKSAAASVTNKNEKRQSYRLVVPKDKFPKGAKTSVSFKSCLQWEREKNPICSLAHFWSQVLVLFPLCLLSLTELMTWRSASPRCLTSSSRRRALRKVPARQVRCAAALTYLLSLRFSPAEPTLKRTCVSPWARFWALLWLMLYSWRAGELRQRKEVAKGGVLGKENYRFPPFTLWAMSTLISAVDS